MQNHPQKEIDPTPIGNIIKQDNYSCSYLQKMCDKTKLIQAANVILAQTLSKPLINHCRITNIEYRIATLSSDNASWATQLRYQQQAISKALQNNNDFNHINFVKIRITPPQALKKKILRTTKMSMQASKTINQAADSITHEGLKQALERLAKNGVVA